MDALTSSSPEARNRARHTVAGVSAFIGVAALGATAALALGLDQHPSGSGSTSTSQVPQSFDQPDQGGSTVTPSRGGPMGTSGGS